MLNLDISTGKIRRVMDSGSIQPSTSSSGPTSSNATASNVTASTSQEENVSQHCTCTELSANDIPGALLVKHTQDCKKTELQFWLKCRSLKYKSGDTKAVLINRVEENMKIDHVIVDPDPNKCYYKLKNSKCVVCNPPSLSEPVDPTCSINNSDSLNLVWGDRADIVPRQLSYISIRKHVETSGRKLVGGIYIEKTMSKGYRFFYENYIHKVSSASDNNLCYIKCLCYRSQKKNIEPHKVKCSLSADGNVKTASCSCVAGVSGQCNHVVGLLYLLSHCNSMNLTTFPVVGTCTENPQQWHRPRSAGLSSEPIMGYCVLKPEYDKSKKGIKSTLYEARGPFTRNNNGADTLFKELKSINANFGFCQNYTNTSSNIKVKTKLGFETPIESTLSHQLAVIEGDMTVYIDLGDLPQSPCTMTTFPNLPLINDNGTVDRPIILPRNLLTNTNYDQVSLDLNECHNLEKGTIGQNSNDIWLKSREIRITSSNFGRILKRRSISIDFARSLQVKKDLSHVAAIRYGREWESKAVDKYIDYMRNSGNPVKCFESGLVVHPDAPWLGASPDRKVIDSQVGLGLLEVKCPYSYRNIKPQGACTNPNFCCEEINKKIILKKSHDYYAQIQGQMSLTGLSWCDFLVFTQKGMLIIRVKFDPDFWNESVIKLTDFYFNYFQPALSSNEQKR